MLYVGLLQQNKKNRPKIEGLPLHRCRNRATPQITAIDVFPNKNEPETNISDSSIFKAIFNGGCMQALLDQDDGLLCLREHALRNGP